MGKELFIEIIQWLVNFSLALTAIQTYLKVNKIWKRKHEREVADSQSIAGLLLLIFNCVLWILYYIYVETDLKSIADTSFYLFEAALFALISTGFFVKGQKGIGLMKLIKQAFRLEKKEANYLIKKFLKPSNAAVIIDILHQLAMIDDDLDPKEEELITAFAKEWNIEYNVSKLNEKRSTSSNNNYITLRHSVQTYLDSEPPTEQAAQLKDMMQTIIEADDEITAEEELISNELVGLVSSYISGVEAEVYQVMVVPQVPDHHSSILTLMPNAEKREVSGGIAYSVGTFYSQKYAEMICDQYREEKLFTIVHSHPTKVEPKPKDDLLDDL